MATASLGGLGSSTEERRAKKGEEGHKRIRERDPTIFLAGHILGPVLVVKMPFDGSSGRTLSLEPEAGVGLNGKSGESKQGSYRGLNN